MAPNLPWAHDTSVPLTILPFGRGRIDFVWESTQEIFENQHKELIVSRKYPIKQQ